MFCRINRARDAIYPITIATANGIVLANIGVWSKGSDGTMRYPIAIANPTIRENTIVPAINHGQITTI